MKFYTKDDMVYQDYNWVSTPADSHKLKGAADRNAFLSSEGHEVLYLINVMAEALGTTSKDDGSRMEKLLHDHLPIGKMSQLSATWWLRKELEK